MPRPPAPTPPGSARARFLALSVRLAPYAASAAGVALAYGLLRDARVAIGVAAILAMVLALQGRLRRLAGRLTLHEQREAAFVGEREVLLRQTLEASDRERQRLAGDLHDGVIQLICAITIRAATLTRGLRREEHVTPERVATTVAGLERITVELQAATSDLRSLMGALANADTERDGLSGALSELLAPLADQGIDVQISIGEMTCGSGQRSLIYRAAQELVRNVAKHASATLVMLTLSTEPEGIRLRVLDNGRGFRADDVRRRRRDGSLGLSLLEQRIRHAGGVLRVDSVPGTGTTAEVLIPVQ